MALSADESGRLADLLTGQAGQVVQRWTEVLAAQLRGRLSQAELVRQVQEMHRVLVDALGKGVGDLAAEEATELRAVLAEVSRGQARQGFTASETASSVFALKEALLTVMETDQGTGTLRDFVAFSALVDQMGLFTFETYVRTRESLIADQAEQLLELSTPVVKLWEGVVAVPLVGTLDSARAQVVMERLLQTLVDTGSPYAIIDITGVPAVDTQVAQHILKTVVAARLMGADCIISGIRPQIAQTIVALGIEFGDIATKASLADALRHVLRLTGVEANRRQTRREV
ncbi:MULTISPECIES: STAS domain-containing protein [unclassified Micromonospora]|uniref:STAS domain-containing protein n=1 Tax=unclassified Micromonospora TaxID=2617518 RepID=UPI001033C5C8|nr:MULTISPECIES: STAS domain-containing protein [unclassified Micromonospora]QKW11571.1 STAS domain-containing protein [Verrucosispora sp. NA02020]QKW11695.1 STAS domain-containing protein [Verrucosispora sp. NA02020]TBL28332.1 STAS domain-containing protein [Verrucosispora sp. SN26_14.1]